MEYSLQGFWWQMLLMTVEAVVVAGAILVAFRIRSWFGITILCVLLGVTQPIQALFASDFFLEVLPGVQLSPTSVVLFSAGLLAVLLVYLREDATVVRTVVYSLVFANVVTALLFLSIGAQLPHLTAGLDLFEGVLNTEVRILVVGTAVLFVDVLAVMVFYEWLGTLIPRSAFARIYLALVGVLAFDSVAFALLAFSGTERFTDVLVYGMLAKFFAAFVYAGMLVLYLRYVEPEGSEFGQTRNQSIRDIFAALSYRQRYELQRAVAEEAFDQVASLHRDLLDATTDALMALDGETRVVDANRRAEVVLDKSRDEMIGQRLDDLVDGDELATDQGTQPEHWIDTLRGSTESSGRLFEATCQTSGSAIRHLDVRVTPVEATHGPVRAFIAIRDVSARRQIFEQRLQATRMESLGRLAGGVAHDFNNLLMVIIGAAALIDADDGDDDSARHARMILDAADRGGRLTQQLLAFARKETMSPGVVDVNDMLQGLHDLLTRVVGNDIELALHLGTGVPSVWISKDQLEQGVINLVSNARDAITGHGVISISTRLETLPAERSGSAKRTFACITVSDTGSGIEREHLSHIFDPFFTTKGIGEGTGLGLSMAHGIAEQAGGQIRVDSTVGEGSTFNLLLPRTTAKHPPVRPDFPSLREFPAADTQVLVVDDDTNVANVVRMMLVTDGYGCHVAHSAQDALDTIATGAIAPDVILTDIVMPDMRGDQLVSRLQEQGIQIPVIFMTGHATGVAMSMDSLGGHPMLHKPFLEDELMAAIVSVLSTTRIPTAGGI